METPDPQSQTPFADALRRLVEQDWLRINVPGHQGRPENAPGVARLVGPGALALDFGMLVARLAEDDHELVGTGIPSPLARAQELAAAAWGASRTWFLTNGASLGSHIAVTAVRALGTEVVMQRSVHSSAVDAMVHVGLTPHFVAPTIDRQFGVAHGVTAGQVADALRANPGCAAVYVVSPSYFGAVADVVSIARVAHDHGVPLIVDEAWGSHFGLHPALPVNAVRLGADLSISSAHKGLGALTQAAMLHLGSGPHAQALEPIVERVVLSYQSTSCSSIILASLDEARSHTAARGGRVVDVALEAAETIRDEIRQRDRFADATHLLMAFDDVVAHDPLKVVVDLRGAGISGADARRQLIHDDRVICEMATPSALLLMIGAGSAPDTARFVDALHRLPRHRSEAPVQPELPAPCPRAVGLSEAFFSRFESVPHAQAIGRVSADSLAAYPPGVPNVLPGEVLTAEVVAFLRSSAASRDGSVRGAADPAVTTFRVLSGR